VDAKLDRTVVEPLPDGPVHLATLDVAGERAVAPAPDAHGAAVDRPCLVDDRADAAAEEQPQRAEAHLQQHVAVGEVAGRVVDGAHHRRVGEGVVAHEPLRDLEAAAGDRLAGRLGGQLASVVVDVPARLRTGVAQLLAIEVQRAIAQRGERALGARRCGELLIQHARARARRRAWW